MSRRRTGQGLADRVHQQDGVDGVSMFMFTVVAAMLLMIVGLYIRNYAAGTDCNLHRSQSDASIYGCK